LNSFAEIREKLIEATIEIFTGMVMMDISSVGEPMERTKIFKKSITGMVGLAGTHKGVLAVHFPNEVALAVTSNFLGMDVEEVNEDVQDAIGEIANMLGGNLKTILSDRGRDIQLSLPSTIFGDEYTFSSQAESDRATLPFHSPSGIFLVEVELER